MMRRSCSSISRPAGRPERGSVRLSRSERRMARELLQEGEFVEVYVDTPLEVCEARDPKGLYKKARAGQIPDFTGISAPYEEPSRPEITLDTSKLSVEESVKKLLAYLEERGRIRLA